MAYASRTLSKAGRNYAQFEREALAIVFGVKRFHFYVYGLKFLITTDHKPLLGVFGEGKPVPPMASSRMIRWSVILQGYDYQLQYRPGSSNHCADALSRLPCEDTLENTPVPFETVHLMQALDRSPVGATEIARLTERDPQLA